jgi:hypothetical protein
VTSSQQTGPDTGSDNPVEMGSTSGQDTRPAPATEGQGGPCLIPAERARAFRERWNELKGEFVDDPQHAVRGIDGLVGEVLDEIEQMFRRQHAELESATRDEHASTEDLRIAFGRYREFFDRLLTV